LAVEAINAAGGVAGRPLELVVRDDRGTLEGAAAADRELIEAGVVAIIGHMSSGQTLAGISVTQKAGVVLFSPAASTPLLSGKDDLFFRITPTNLDQAAGLAQHIYQERKLGRIAVVYDTDNAAYTESYAGAFAQALGPLGGAIVKQITFSAAANPDLTQLAADLQAANPDGLLIIASAINTAFIAQRVRLNNWNVPLFSSAWAQTEALIQNGGQAVEGLEIVIAYDANSQAPAFQTFKASYEKRFGRAPTFAAGEAYETVQVLAAALQKTGGQAWGLPQALLQTKNFPVLTGAVSLDDYGDV
jgi:branched-chain amino acid transport system substrate-binding protein